MNRLFHRWLALAITVPFLVVVTTGVLLQMKRWVPGIQPKSQKSDLGPLEKMENPIGWDQIFLSVKLVPEAQVQSWKDIKVVDVRPTLGVARVRTRNGYEVQVDLATGRTLSSAPRYSSILIEIHEGSFFGSTVRNFIFVPAAFLTFLVTLSGVWLLVVHYYKKGKRKWAEYLIARVNFGSAWKQNSSF